MATMNSIGTNYPIEVPDGGTGEQILNAHSILVGENTTDIKYIAVGNDGEVLQGNTGADPSWTDSPSIGGSLTITNGFTVQGGTITLTPLSRGVVQSSATGVLSSSEGIDGQIMISSSSGAPAWANITNSDSFLNIVNGSNTIDIQIDSNARVAAIQGWNGAIIESPVVDVTSDGSTITFGVERSGTGDLTVVFSDGFYNWDTTPKATVTLTAGTDTNPALNYVYFDKATKTLIAATAGWPSAEHAPLATVLCQSAASVATDGPYKVHAWTDHIIASDNQGHISHLNYWIRHQNATWNNGVAQTLTITTNSGAKDNVIFTSTSGEVLQLHNHTFPAFSGTPDLYVVNDSTTSYKKITDLNEIDTDSSGSTLVDRHFTLVIWGVVSEATSDCKLMVNLPSGSYSTANYAKKDAKKKANYSIPSEFVGTGFLIAAYVLHYSSSDGGTWTNEQFTDLRGLFPSITAGGSTDYPSEFEDSLFRINDDADPTKQIAFQASAITTGTTRTITMDDRDIDLDAVPDSFSTDSGSATPASGSVTIAGGTNIATSGSGSTVTVNFDGTLPISSGGTNASSMANTYGVNYYDGTSIVTTAVGTSGQVLTSNGAGVAPTFQDAATGGAVDSVTGGTNINVTGTATDPVVNLDDTISLSGSITAGTGITISSGDLDITSGKIDLPTTSSSVGQITINSVVGLQMYGTRNTFAGGAGNFSLTGTDNIGIGSTALDSLTSGNYNVAIGTNAGTAIDTGHDNVTIGYNAFPANSSTNSVFIGSNAGASASGTLHTAIGDSALKNISNSGNTAVGYHAMMNATGGYNNTGLGAAALDGITTGSYNVGVGVWTLKNVTTGDNNIAIGCYETSPYGAGANLTTSDSNNILISNLGTAGDNNTIRIGTQGSGSFQQNKTYIAGIYNTTPSGGNDGTVIVDSNGQLGSTTALTGYAQFNAQTGTAYTLVLSDANKIVTMNNAAANTLTVPPNSSVAFPTGTMVAVIMKGAGQTSIAAGTGVTINSESSNLKIDGQYASALLIKEDTDTWYLVGQLTS